MRKLLSVVLPCHNEAENIKLLVPEIIKNIPSGFNYEIICVDDGSKDKTRSEITNLCRRSKKIKGVFLYKRSGHQAALRAGLLCAKGVAIITMDADFQHPPTLIPKFVALWQKGFDVVNACKAEDKSVDFATRQGRKIGYFLWQKITGGLIRPAVSDFRLISSEVVTYLKSSHETKFFLRGMVSLAGKNITEISYRVNKRRFGNSSYSLSAFVNMFVEGFVSFSLKPLRLAFVVGSVVIIVTMIVFFFDLLLALRANRPIIEGYKTLAFLSIILNGFIIIYMSILGEYLGVIFSEVKKRPSYIVKETLNIDESHRS
ncbi:MAG: hypothetical protein UV74_C0002G0065 [Candidatus Woesebacteria bacterium GW2011_GWB1_43_14]|uniref:Glycosyltransferase 2-like domain-containing protein n=1 Tax=Candidatus Woesebacteria bacterium GW2011_GWB1_43_14 TaxID=1618578 RepID=A0A0G1DMH6_9BACT|nr:MAG: hypothetical protein UV51_C0004G0014 [Candidatus Woesebacteria bacterium GW2011_GWC1_42_9]KKS98844.1 MAG: hypothetical protein UV74_C0002G0065 [Candidatus Woesebacteria bacterium GW2011_GWB1_43_14]